MHVTPTVSELVSQSVLKCTNKYMLFMHVYSMVPGLHVEIIQSWPSNLVQLWAWSTTAVYKTSLCNGFSWGAWFTSLTKQVYLSAISLLQYAEFPCSLLVL